MRQSSVGSRSIQADNPQGSRRAVASKAAPSQPKHAGAESQRGPRHVSSCRLIPGLREKKQGLQKTQRGSTSDCDSSARAEKQQQQGRWKEGQRSPQECHRHVCYRIFSVARFARACSLSKLLLRGWGGGAFSTSEKSLSDACFDFAPWKY